MKDENRLKEVLGSLARAELSATHTYETVLGRSREKSQSLIQIYEDHRNSAEALIEILREEGVSARPKPTTWKNMNLLAELSVNPLKDPFALNALKEGEQQDILTYEQALAGDIDPNLRELIQRRLLPRTKQHIATIDKLLVAA